MLGRAALTRLEQLDPGQAGHDDVAHDDGDFVEELERSLGGLGADGLVAAALEDLDHQVADHRLVVDHEHAAHASAPLAGRLSRKHAPSSGPDLTVSEPPWACAMPRLTDRPRPVPPTSRLVV